MFLPALLRRLRYRRLRRHDIRLLLLDVDGTLTDGGMYYAESGDVLKKFNAKDGLAIRRLMVRIGVEVGLISSSDTAGIIEARARTLGIGLVHAGKGVKAEIISGWLSERGLGWAQLAYIGDDLNDLEAIERAGVSACPSDAVAQVRSAAKVVLRRRGGDACVREFIEEVMGWDLTA